MKYDIAAYVFNDVIFGTKKDYFAGLRKSSSHTVENAR